MDKYNCAKECAKEPTEHEFISESGEYNEIYKIKCKSCSNEQEVHRHAWLSFQTRNHVRPSRAYLDKYPRYEAQTGLWVTSKDDMKEKVYAAGFHYEGDGQRDKSKEKDWAAVERTWQYNSLSKRSS